MLLRPKNIAFTTCYLSISYKTTRKPSAFIGKIGQFLTAKAITTPLFRLPSERPSTARLRHTLTGIRKAS